MMFYVCVYIYIAVFVSCSVLVSFCVYKGRATLEFLHQTIHLTHFKTKQSIEVPLKGSAEKHYKRWRNENHLFQDAIGHHIQGVTMHDGEWDSHGSIRSWNITCDGKPEVFKEKREIDDERMALALRGLEGQAMEKYKVYDVIYQFIPKWKEGCVCKITMIWEKGNENSPEPINYMKFVKSLVADMDDHILKGQNKA